MVNIISPTTNYTGKLALKEKISSREKQSIGVSSLQEVFLISVYSRISLDHAKKPGGPCQEVKFLLIPAEASGCSE
jgi:hypothetical protein